MVADAHILFPPLHAGRSLRLGQQCLAVRVLTLNATSIIQPFRPLGKVHSHNAHTNSFSTLIYCQLTAAACLTLRPKLPRPHLTKEAMDVSMVTVPESSKREDILHFVAQQV